MRVVCTRNSRSLATLISEQMRVSLCDVHVKEFSCSEHVVSIPESFETAIIVASTLTSDDWIELFLLLDAVKMSRRVILCMSYMGYARQCENNKFVSDSSRLFTKLLEVSRIDYCFVVENHSELFFRVPFSHISTVQLFENNIAKRYDVQDIVIVSPDIGGVKRAKLLARRLGCSYVICDKSRNVFGKLSAVQLFGDVSRKKCIIVDDIVDTGQTVFETSKVLMSAGAKSVDVYATHGLLSSNAIELINVSDIDRVVLTNSVNCDSIALEKIERISIASLMSEAIRCIL